MIAAFDLGVKNFAFAVFDPAKDEKGSYILLKNNNLNEEDITKTELNNRKKCDLICMMEKLNIKQEEKIKKKDMVEIIYKKQKRCKKAKDIGVCLFNVLDEFKEFWAKCDVFLIERQMLVNRQALKLSHFLEAYLKMHYNNKKIINYNASLKTKRLGAEKLKTKAERKKWTVQFVSRVLDADNLQWFETLFKKDDIADVICMIESYKIKRRLI